MSTAAPYRIAINGYGRIGQCVLRALYENRFRDHLQVVAINELADIDTIAHLTRYDSTHGRFQGEINVEGDSLLVNGDRIRVVRCAEASELPWDELGIDLVLECSGAFTDRATAEQHLKAGAERLLFSQPAESDVDRTIVYGVNQDQLAESDRIVAAASCTTNCLAPLAWALNNEIGIEKGFMTTIHAYTGDQNLVDGSHKDLRRARAAAQSMIPTSTGAAKALGLVLPEMIGKLDGTAIRVPTANVSLVDLSFVASKATSVDALNDAMQSAANGALKDVLGATAEPLVSIDLTHTLESSIVDLTGTKVMNGTLCRVASWYDNEWGFSNRMLDLARMIGG